VRYGQAISSAFTTLKSGALWSFAVSIYGVVTAVYVGLLGGALAIAGPARLAELLKHPAANGDAWIGPVLMLTGAFTLAMLISIPLTLIMHGGFIHLADEILAGRPVTVGQGWSFGASRMGRTFAIDFVVGLITFGATTVALIPFMIAVFGLVGATGSGSGSDALTGTAIVGICCGYFFFLLLIVGISMLVSGYEALAIRYGLVGTRTSGAALSAGWQAFKAAWKNVVVFSLIVVGLQYVFSFATSIITVPLQFVLLPNQFTASGSTPSLDQLPQMVTGYSILMLVSIIITVPWMVFRYSLWGAFFRQVTGLDVAGGPAAPLMPPAPPETPASDAPLGAPVDRDSWDAPVPPAPEPPAPVSADDPSADV